MYNRLQKINSRGFTLVEMVASIALLGMVIAVFLPIFPQIMGWTENTDEELVASNLLSQVASDTEHIEVVDFFDDSIEECNAFLTEDVYYKEYPLNGDIYKAKLNVCKEINVELYRTKIKIYSSNDRLVSESYTYISGDSNE
ncbi:type II secretion system protein [Virgibacillus byunsanensis]|uniref:Type II secretion system protein n=1 Tax=Virgibacillus byunsanensis TaxID=570945 RepID=A0ABW3LJA9_9BACI